MMRIGIDATSLLCQQPRGEGKTLLRLYQEMARQHTECEFVLFGERHAAPNPLPNELREIARSRVVLFDCPGFRFNTWENLGLPWQAWRAGCDVLHSTSSGTPRWAPLPVVMTVHDLIPLLHEDGQTERERARFQQRLQHGVRIASKIITVSENTRADLLQVFPAARDKVDVIHWGAEPPMPSALQSARPLEAPYVVAFGGGAPRKNTQGVMHAFTEVARQHAQVKLVLLGIGQPAEQQHWQEQAATLGWAERLVMPGYVSEAALHCYLRHAHCLLYLSLYEGFGMPLVETMSYGVPAIASRRSSIPEVVGEAGFLVEPEDTHAAAQHVLELLNRPFLHEAYTKAARDHVRLFDWQLVAQKTYAILHTAASRKR